MAIKINKERIYFRGPSATVLFVAAIEGSVPDSALTSAVRKACARYRVLSCKLIQDDAGEAFFVPCDPPRAVEVIADPEPFDWDRIVREEEKRVFRFEDGEFVRFRIFRGEDTTLLLSGHHLAGDANAWVFLLRDIMTCLSDPDTTLPEIPITLCDPDTAAHGVKLPLSIRLMVKTVNGQWKRGGRQFSFEDYETLCQKYWEQRDTSVLKAVFQPEETEKLLAKCRELDITVNSALAAAFVLGAQESSVGVAVNVREKGCETLGNYATGISVDYFPDADTSFDTRAQEVHAAIYQKLSDPKARGFLLKFMSLIAPTLIDAAYFSAFGGYANPIASRAAQMFGFTGTPKGVSLTNLARLPIPCAYGKYRLREVVFVPPLVPGASRLVGAAALDGALCLTMHFDARETDRMQEDFSRAVGYLRRMAGIV